MRGLQTESRITDNIANVSRNNNSSNLDQSLHNVSEEKTNLDAADALANNVNVCQRLSRVR